MEDFRLFILPDCPYCRRVLAWQEELLAAQPLEYEYQLIPRTGEDFPYELVGIPRDYRWQPGGENVPVYPWKGRAIWGLTARITRHLAALVRSLERE